LGLTVVKADPNQGHDWRSVFEGFTAWEVGDGVEVSYTSHYTFIDLDLLASVNSKGSSFGLAFGQNTSDMVVNGATIEGFGYGVKMEKSHTSNTPIDYNEFGYVLIDVDTRDIGREAFASYDPRVDKIISSNSLVDGRLELRLDFSKIPVYSGEDIYIDGTKTDSIGSVDYPLGSDKFVIGRKVMSSVLSHEGYYTSDDGKKYVIIEEYFSDRATGKVDKVGIPIQIADSVSLTSPGSWWLGDGDAVHLGRIDLKSLAPIAHDDAAATAVGHAVIINVLANDRDPENNPLKIDGIHQPLNGKVVDNGNGTVTYTPQNGFVGEETFDYWATDGNGKFNRATVELGVFDDLHDMNDWESAHHLPHSDGALF
jgi:hypothetical protein